MHVSSTARRYGRSLAKVAMANRREKTVGEELQGLWQFFRDNPVPRLLLESAGSSSERQGQLLSAIEAAVPLSDYTKNFLRLVVEARRFSLFREILEAYRQDVDRYHGIVEVQVVSATPLDDTQRESLRGTLQRTVAAGKEVRLDLQVDPSLVAGAVTRIGSVVYDGSLTHQLNQIRQQLISE
jgi:F-type H+-transporting ATPase subunit delta